MFFCTVRWTKGFEIAFLKFQTIVGLRVSPKHILGLFEVDYQGIGKSVGPRRLNPCGDALLWQLCGLFGFIGMIRYLVTEWKKRKGSGIEFTFFFLPYGLRWTNYLKNFIFLILRN
ncbi:hypothetical protein L1049_021736 [Liquidambar formosana]|uniref:Uncharacterized protein n=1 Tax=Liquidambar formosana TaxID=63359 RepID=A0AAP0RBE3_LIQFO